MIGNKPKKGQILLIAVMLIATIITVVMTVAFNTTSETQLSKLQADSQQALAAADAGVQAALKQSATVNISSLGDFATQGISGNATVTATGSPFFASPLLQKDEQYTFYLSDYPGFGNPWAGGALDILFSSENGQCVSIEVTTVKTDGTLQKSAYNTSCNSIISGATLATQQTNTIGTTQFQWTTGSVAVVNARFMLIRVYGGRTRIGVQSHDKTTNLPLQGKTVSSEARTQSGVVKRVVLFQSYPQIPASFYNTSF